MIQKFLLAGTAFGALLAVASVTLALAEDAPGGALVPGMQLAQMPPPPPIYTWNGFYVGVNIGGAWAFPHTNSPLTNNGVAPAYIPSVVTDINNQAKMNPSLSGVTGGGQLGYNFQFNNIVVGAEGEFDGWEMHRTGSTSMPFTGFPVPAAGVAPTYTNTVSSDWWASVRGRLGWTPTPSLLLYATGGVAFADFSYSHRFVEGVFPGTSLGAAAASSTQTLVAPAVGGGLEFMVAPGWSLKAEYLYIPFGSISLKPTPVVFPGPVIGGSVFSSKATNLDTNVIRVGLNYHFGAPAPMPPAPMAAPAPPPAAPVVFIVFFDWDKDTITREGMGIVQQAADAYKSGAPVQIQVTGYTDRSGSPGYNQRLSERRANRVAKALAALGVPPASMVVTGRGENDNRVPTADGVREPQNRRVEIVKP